MVRERVNQEITRQHKLGRLNLPPLQPPGSLDGFEMFGFTSPSIVQVNNGKRFYLQFLSFHCNFTVSRSRLIITFLTVLFTLQFSDSSCFVKQAIEAMDRNRVCSEYWDSRPYSRPQVQIPQASRSKHSAVGLSESSNNHIFPVGMDTILESLLKKANVEELNSLYRMLNDNEAGRDLVTRLLNKEINNRQ